MLLAKLHYVCAAYADAINYVNNSGLERQDIQFHTLRTLRLVADAYAIKGLSLERQAIGQPPQQLEKTERQILYCFEKSADLALSYIQELEKSSSGDAGAPTFTIQVQTESQRSSGSTAASSAPRHIDRIGVFQVHRC